MKKKCKQCKEEKDINKYQKYSYNSLKQSPTCIDCKSINSQNSLKNYKMINRKFHEENKTLENLSILYKCSLCEKELNIQHFHKKYDSIRGCSNECKKCYSFKYYTPRQRGKEIKEKQKIEKETCTKYCPKCKNYLDYKMFNKSNRLKEKDGLQTHCKNCRNIYKNTPENKIHKNMASGIRRAIKNKNQKTFDIVGYTKKELMEHLEKQFDNKMTWENYGKYWHIDHIIPISYFKIKSEQCKNFKLCWRLENLRPLEASVNMSKQNKILEEFKHLIGENT